MRTIGQKRVERTIVGNSFPLKMVGNTTATDLLGIPSPANAAKTLKKGLVSATKSVEVLVDETGQVCAQKLIVGDREQWGWRREYVERVQRQRQLEVRRREADAKRRKTAQAKVAA